MICINVVLLYYFVMARETESYREKQHKKKPQHVWWVGDPLNFTMTTQLRGQVSTKHLVYIYICFECSPLFKIKTNYGVYYLLFFFV